MGPLLLGHIGMFFVIILHETSVMSTPGQFGPLVSKNDDEEHCFLKKFGFRNLQIRLEF